MNRLAGPFVVLACFACPACGLELASVVIPAGGAVQAAGGALQVVTVGEAAAGPGAGQVLGLGFPYTVITLPPLVYADLAPATLNLKSQGKYVTVSFEVLGLKSAADIQASSLKIASIAGLAISPIPAETKAVSLGDANEDGIMELTVKFDRQALIAVLPVSEQVSLGLAGLFKDGSAFSAEGYLRTIMPGAVPAHSGGSVRLPGGAAVEAPAGAMSQDLGLYVVKVSAEREQARAWRREAAARRKLALLGEPYSFGPEGSAFSRPVTVSLPFDQASMPKGAKAKDLAVVYWDPDKLDWDILQSSYDPGSGLVSAEVSHFSLYQAAAVQTEPEATAPPGAAPPGAGPAAQAFAFHDAYAFPNPVRARGKAVIRFQAGLADSVEVRLFDLTGEPAGGGSAGTARLVDDGNGKGSLYTYDYEWDLSRVGSGVYVYVITARRQGYPDIRRVGRLGVLK